MKWVVALLLLCGIAGGAVAGEWVQRNFDATLAAWGGSGDIDADGDTDLWMLNENGGLVWSENQGNGVFVPHEIIAYAFGVQDISLVDFDYDGDLDFFSSAPASIRIFRNDGSGTWAQIIVVNGVTIGPTIDVDDHDSDGDYDILIGLSTSLVWYEALNTTGYNWTSHTHAGLSFYDYIHGDGWNVPNEVFAASSSSNILYKITFDPPNAYTQTMRQLSCYSESMVIAPVDGTVPRVLAANALTETVGWNTGSGPVTTVGSCRHNRKTPPVACDADGDGDVDLFVLDANSDFYLYTNVNGGGAVWNSYLLHTGGPSTGFFCVLDVDDDGDLDVVYAEANGSTRWLENPGSLPLVSVYMFPEDDEIIVPRGGGFTYDASLRSHVQGVNTLDIWTEAVLPSGNTYGPVWVLDDLTLWWNGQVSATGIYQAIPASAPLGTYMFVLKAGNRPNYVAGRDRFEFTVTASGADNFRAADSWNAWGYQALAGNGDRLRAESLPSTFTLAEVWPNPFNAAAMVQVNLPSAAELTVAVYNVTGQQVATLAHGQFSAGQHQFVLDADNKASGIYFIRAMVPGESVQVRKVALVQ